MSNDTKNPHQEHKSSILDKITVKEIWPLLTLVGSIVLTAASTFFFTRAALQSRLSTVEAKLHTTEGLRIYTDAAFVHHQINSLRVLQDEFSRLEAFFSHWSAPQLKYGRRIPWSAPNTPDAPFDIVIDRTDAPLNYNLATDITAFYQIVTSPHFRAVPDAEFVAKTYSIYDSLVEFMIAVKEDITATGTAFRLSPVSPFQGMPRVEAEKRIQTAAEKATYLRGMLQGMSKKAEESRQALEKNLPIPTP